MLLVGVQVMASKGECKVNLRGSRNHELGRGTWSGDPRDQNRAGEKHRCPKMRERKTI